jgi:hypothetical protein
MLTKTSIHAELSGSSVCSAAGQIGIGHAPVLALCRELIAAEHDPATPVEVYRGDTVALRIRTIGEAAALEINAKGTGFAVRPVRTASPIAQNAAGLVS